MKPEEYRKLRDLQLINELYDSEGEGDCFPVDNQIYDNLDSHGLIVNGFIKLKQNKSIKIERIV